MNPSNTDLAPKSTTDSVSTNAIPEPQRGRNEPCPCGSGKKYKRCHGVDAAPKLSAPAAPAMAAGGGAPMAGPGGFDPSKVDPAMMSQMTKALQRLPRGQLMKLQSIMQRAQSGQDVSRDAAEFERMLPPEFSQMAMQMMMAQGMAGGAAPEMNTDDAKQIVAKAVAEGKMTEEQAKELLGGETSADILAKAEKKGISGFFKKITGK
ncbi:MAG: SEC-C domain-containing protein [Bdellovibrionales bacterium]|nr:SEC-C domain-containing protein [Bdellovibrionales bacterium]